jgi:hypothetical protein
MVSLRNGHCGTLLLDWGCGGQFLGGQFLKETATCSVASRGRRSFNRRRGQAPTLLHHFPFARYR